MKKIILALIYISLNIDLNAQNNCIEQDTISLDTIISDVYTAGSELNAQSLVQANAHVLFSAGQSIHLLPGFEIPQGATLSTQIAPCEPSVTLAPNVIVIQEDTNDGLISMTNTTMTFAENTPNLAQLIENCIILSDTTAAAPNGYLRKITNVENFNGQVILTTERAALSDALQSANFDFEVDLEDTGEELNRLNQAGFNFNLEDYPINEDLSLNGNINIDPKLVFEITKFTGITEPIDFKIGTKGNVTFDIGLSYSPSGSSNISHTIELYEKKLKPIVKTIPYFPFAVPVVIVPELEIKLITELNGPTIHLDYQSTGAYQAVVRKINNEWINDNANNFTFTGNFLEVSVETISGSVTLRFELDFELYDYDPIEAFVFVEGQGNFSSQGSICMIEPQVNVGGGLEIDFLERFGFEEGLLSVSYPFSFQPIIYTHPNCIGSEDANYHIYYYPDRAFTYAEAVEDCACYEPEYDGETGGYYRIVPISIPNNIPVDGLHAHAWLTYNSNNVPTDACLPFTWETTLFDDDFDEIIPNDNGLYEVTPGATYYLLKYATPTNIDCYVADMCLTPILYPSSDLQSDTQSRNYYDGQQHFEILSSDGIPKHLRKNKIQNAATANVRSPITPSADNHSMIPLTLAIHPNPVDLETNLHINNPQSQRIQIQLYNINGTLIRNIFDGRIEKGGHQIKLEAAGLTSGLYYLSMKTNTEIITQKILIEKTY